MSKTQQTLLDRICKDYTYRDCPPNVDPIRHHDREAVRTVLMNAALDLVRIVPSSRELNHALNRIEEALGWAHAAIDRYGESSPAEGL
jgi:hypothetical protein